MMRVILGGTFDPIHKGHEEALASAAHELGAEQVVLLPNGVPPHRPQPLASTAQRLAMVELVAATHANWSVERYELEQQQPSYMVKTLRALRQRWPNDSLVLLIGDDALAGLTSWYQWQDLLTYAHLGILRRPDLKQPLQVELAEYVQTHQVEAVTQLQQHKAGCIYFTASTIHPISATAIRASVASHASADNLLNPAVRAYIEQQQLYR
ncbi:nicotinate-nucleotide adenylyltransferase [Pseudidiomarina taiwanensis]|uniref:Probable nicotinate-nucleotide adenylyltransferase n=1 Tax=Pseudidiomarina taiwanensis TaxID=337250 RepID=A0A432ZP64_9GAMM|nr:nicotinate-nucleotide adenylyltransferase [Pseudidiomarina taiwanensis]RUO79642.1 nicotinic acid mononucleotide adenylyltransferase [Pseudidiomarina taiwanensis]